MPNFVEITQNAAEIWQFFSIFQDDSPPPSWIFKSWKFQLPVPFEGPICVTVPNFAKIGQTFWRYGRFSIFQDGGRRHLGFWKFRIFNGWDAQEGRTASACQILAKSLKTRQRYSDFSIFQDGGRPPSWIGFTRVGTTHEEYLVVFATVQNLVVIGAEISTVCKF